MSDFIRARSPEQKHERMEAIMEAANELFQDRPYHQITMGTIAEKLGWSRSNLYKYAATQEEIFLALHTAKNREWLADLTDSLSDAPLDHDAFASLWAKAAERHPDFLRYQEILISIIESNVTIERLTEFKRDFMQMIRPVVSLLARQCDVSESDASDLYLRLLFQAPSLYSHFHCTELAKQAMQAAGMKLPTGTFADSYASFVAMCLKDAAK